jgi:D-aminopeptidase
MTSEFWQHSPAGHRRGRGLGLKFSGTPGPYNAITDVSGVEVGVCTLVEGEGPLRVGFGPVRTGVTAILPRGQKNSHIACAAGSYCLNGNGEMTGLQWIEEAGELQTPITLTNTSSCGVARDGILKWMVENKTGAGADWTLPVAAETYDGDLNDMNGFHVKDHHVMAALDQAHGGAVELGSVGGGTGMLTYDFKAGNGSSSRVISIDGETFTVGVFVQSNFGRREDLMVLGVPVGKSILQDKLRGREMGSIIAIVATDAPLQAHQLKRLARRVPMGLARTGTIASNGSGDIFLAFSTANAESFISKKARRQADYLAADAMDEVFRAVVEATEEAVLDSMICNDTMVGRDGNRAIALPIEQMLDIMRGYGRG